MFLLLVQLLLDSVATGDLVSGEQLQAAGEDAPLTMAAEHARTVPWPWDRWMLPCCWRAEAASYGGLSCECYFLEVWRGDEMLHNYASGIYTNLEENEETQLFVFLLDQTHSPSFIRKRIEHLRSGHRGFQFYKSKNIDEEKINKSSTFSQTELDWPSITTTTKRYPYRALPNQDQRPQSVLQKTATKIELMRISRQQVDHLLRCLFQLRLQ